MLASRKNIRSGLQTCRRGLWVAGVFSVALNALMLTVPLYMMQVYDRVLSSRSEETLLMLTLVAVGALAMFGMLEAVRQTVLLRTGARLEAELGGRVLDASLQAARHRGPDVQELRDLSQVRQFVSSPLVSALFDAPVAPFYIALIYIIHPQLGWLTITVGTLLVIASLINQQLTKAPLSEASQHLAAAFQQAQAQARNADVIRSMGMSSNAVNAWGRHNALALTASDRAGRRNALLTGSTRFLRLFLQIAILGYGAYLVLADSSLSAGIIIAASIISARALAPIDQAIGGWNSFVNALHAWRRLSALLAEAPPERDRMALPAPDGRISAEQLIYAPAPGKEPIVKGVSFAIEPGEAVGIIGPSGAGKSTLARLLVGALSPTSGRIRIGGDELGHWTSEALGPHIGYLPQDVELFPATVAENIARLSPSPDPQKVIAAAELANCHALIQALPGGFETQIGPHGHALSGGQRQRIALARAFYGEPKVVVLDEPNASLDSEGDQALLAALMKATQTGMTCVVITQRAGVLPACSKIMLLREGRIEAFGPREAVLQRQLRTATAGGQAVGPVGAPDQEAGSEPDQRKRGGADAGGQDTGPQAMRLSARLT